jgi:hypothetical protein
MGDPLRLEMCTGVDVKQFDRYGGSAVLDNWRLFGGCFVDVYASRDLALDVYAQAIATTEADAIPPDKRTTFGSLRAERYPDEDGTCSWLLYAGQFDVRVGSSTPSTAAQRRTACEATGLLARQVGEQLSTGHEPTRTIPSHSVSEYDMCSVVKAAHVDRLTDIGAGAASDVNPYYLGSECVVSTDTYSVNVLPVIDFDPVQLGAQVTSGGHSFSTVDVHPTRCRMASQQQATGVGGAEELLVFDVRFRGATAPASDLCRIAERVGGAVLDAAELR